MVAAHTGWAQVARQWAIGLGIVGLILGVGLNVPAMRRQLQLSFTREPARYSAMFFEGTPSVTAAAGRSRVALHLGVSNHQTSRQTYLVRVVTATPQGKTSSSSQSSITVDAGATGHLVLSVGPLDTATWEKVVVSATGVDGALSLANPQAVAISSGATTP